MRLTEKATVLAALALVAMATILTGCGGVGDETPPEATAAIVVVGVIDKESQDFLQVPASVLMAADDPVIPLASFQDWPLPAHSQLLISRWGGHCGFIENLHGDGWAEHWVCRQLQQM